MKTQSPRKNTSPKLERLISKDMRIVTSSLKNFESLSEQNFLNVYIYLVKNAIMLSYTKEFSLSCAHLREIINSSKNMTNDEIGIFCEKIASKTIRTNVLSDDQTIDKEITITIFEKISFDRNANLVTFTVPKSFIDEYINTDSGRYVKIVFSVMKSIKNKYAPKIIEYLTSQLIYSSDATNNDMVVSLESLKAALDSRKRYPEYKKFNENVLKKVQQESERIGLVFEYDSIRTGRKITHIVFKIENDNKKAFQAKISRATKSKDKDMKNDKLLLHVRAQASEVTLDLLKSKLMKVKEFSDHVADILPGKKYSMYVLVYKNAKYFNERTHQEEPLFRLVNFAELKDLTKYFSEKGNEKELGELKLIQDILYERRA